MKLLLIGILSVMVYTAGASQTVPSDCTAPDSVVTRYAEDAAWMTFRQLLDSDSSYIDSIPLPQSSQDTFLRAMLAVYNAPLAASDTVTGKLFNYYTYKDYSLNTIFIWGDTSILWIRQLLKRVIPTGDTLVDSILLAYGMTVDTAWADGWVWLKTDRFYNTKAISKLFDRLSIRDASPQRWVGDGDWIHGYTFDNTVILTYSIGWDDCLAGCINRRFWRFTVFPDCSVRFDSSFGDHLPLADVKNQSDKKPILFFFPNPAAEKLTLFVEPNSVVEIIDVQGRVVMKLAMVQSQAEVSLAHIPKGIYLIRALGSGIPQVAKFIKQ